MINEASSASVYTDFKGLAELRVAAARQTPESMRETARQFEALFVQTMLKAMRDASHGDGIFESDQTEFYRDIYDQQLALEIVKGRGLGIADMLMRDLGGASEAQAKPPEGELQPASVLPSLAEQPRPLVALDNRVRPLVDLASTPDRTLIDTPSQVPAGETVASDWRPANPLAFIRELLPVARQGAARLGVQPGVLVAQAALETGWGQKMVRHADGRNSFNLFGIKADGRWDGARATVTTLEYRDGIARRERAAFRAYDSLAASVRDYVEFLQGNPRYTQAIESNGDSMAFLRELKDAGYATDPDYVEKIRSIMDGEHFRQGLQPLLAAEQAMERLTATLW